MRFEVASIHPHRSSGDEPSNRQMLPGGRFVATATTARTLIRIAFGTDDERISGAPNWIGNETFDINAITANHTASSSGTIASKKNPPSTGWNSSSPEKPAPASSQALLARNPT
jgi:uncharacterized protein (TIGR03435 family)